MIYASPFEQNDKAVEMECEFFQIIGVLLFCVMTGILEILTDACNRYS